MSEPLFYTQPSDDMYLLHNPLDSTEAVITPSTDRDKITELVSQGAVIVHQSPDGQREVATIEDLPEPESTESITLVVPAYVDTRAKLLMAAIQAVARFLTDTDLIASMQMAADALESDDMEILEAATEDLAGFKAE